MATRNYARKRAGAPLSPPSEQDAGGSPALEDEFDDLFRRLLVAVNHVELVSQHFGDLSSLDRADVPAGLTLYEAAQDLDALYDDIDSWYVRHEHPPKTVETVEPSVDKSEESDERTDGQRLYDDVAGLERQIKDLMDEIPYSALGASPKTSQALDDAETHLRDAVACLQKAWNEEVPRFNRARQAVQVKDGEP